jgi:hypothetical protein
MNLSPAYQSAESSWTRLFGTLAIGTALFCGAVSAFAQPLHLVKGQQLADEIEAAYAAQVYTDGAGIPLNRYGGSWGSATDASYIRFLDTGAGVLPGNNTKCSPLVTHLLKHAYNWSWSGISFHDPLLKTTKTVSSPTPYQYIQLLKDGKGFASRIHRLDQAQAGDILLWWQVGTDDKDHAMIITRIDLPSAKSYPTDHAKSKPEFAGTTYYEVEILDSSANLHTNDSRLVTINGVDTHLPGIGTGTIGVLVDANFGIVGTTWSLPTSNYTTQRGGWLDGLHSRLKRAPAYEIAIGRWP